jgi:COMPASS component SWD3
VHIEEIPGWQNVTSFQAHLESITSMGIAPNGRRMVTASLDRKVRLWAPADGTLQSELRRGGEIIRCVAISPDGSLIAVGGDGAILQIWDAETGSLRHTLKNTERFSKRITKVGFSSTSHLLVTVAADNQVGLWDVRTGGWLGHYGKPDELGRATSVAMSRENQFAAGYANGSVVIWQLFPRSPRWSLAVHQTEVTAIGLSPLEFRLVTGGEDRTLRIWYPEDGSELLRIPADVETMKQIEWTPDGHSLVTLAADGTIGYWNGTP